MLLSLSTTPLSAREGFGSPAGHVLSTALQCCCLSPPNLSQPVRVSAVLQDMFCRLLCNVVVSVHRTSHSQWGFRQSCRTCSVDCSAMLLSQSTEPLSASEGFGSPAGHVLSTALQCCCLSPPNLSQPVRVSAVLQDMFCRLLCNVVVSVHRTSLSQWGFRQSCRTCSVDCSAMLLSQSTEPLSASEGFGSPAGHVLSTALQCCCLSPPNLSQPVRVSAVLQDMFCRLLCNVVVSVHRTSLSQWGFRQSCRTCSVDCSAMLLSQSTEPLSASEGFSSPAGCVVMTALQCWYLWGFQQSYLSQWGFWQSCLSQWGFWQSYLSQWGFWQSCRMWEVTLKYSPRPTSVEDGGIRPQSPLWQTLTSRGNRVPGWTGCLLEGQTHAVVFRASGTTNSLSALSLCPCVDDLYSACMPGFPAQIAW